MNLVSHTVPESPDTWSLASKVHGELYCLRRWDGRMWRKDIADWYYGGYRLLWVGADSKLAQTWENNWRESL